MDQAQIPNYPPLLMQTGKLKDFIKQCDWQHFYFVCGKHYQTVQSKLYIDNNIKVAIW